MNRLFDKNKTMLASFLFLLPLTVSLELNLTEAPFPFSIPANDFVITDDGTKYLATTRGIYRNTNGSWQRIPSDRRFQYYARSLHWHTNSGLIYWGGLHDFGVIQYGDDNKPIAKSFIRQVHPDLQRSGYVSHIAATDNLIFFLTPSRIFLFKDQKWEIIRAQNSFSGLYQVQENIFVVDRSAGIMQWRNNRFEPVNELRSLRNHQIRSMVAHNDKIILIATLANGLWKYDVSSATLQSVEFYIEGDVTHHRIHNLRSKIVDSQIYFYLYLINYGVLILDENLITVGRLPVEPGMRNTALMSLFWNTINRS